VTYIASLSGARWENWQNDWVIASAEVNDRLALPSDGPKLDRKQWRVKHASHRSLGQSWTGLRNWWLVA
jgi:hypothetical protein